MKRSQSPKTFVDCPLCHAPAGHRHTPGCSWVAMQRMSEDEALRLVSDKQWLDSLGRPW